MGETRPLKLVFMGTPDLAMAVLETVLAWPGGQVAAVYSQPDRPAGRGLEQKFPPVKTLALKHGIPVFQPLNWKADADLETLASFAPDYLLVAAYGLILPRKVLAVPKNGALNVHTSLLPRYRGAAPIQRAVMNGERETGVSIMLMEAGLDTGPVLLQRSVPIGPCDTAGTLHDTLAALGGTMLVETLQGLEAGALHPVPQDERGASYAAKLEKSDGAIDFARSSVDIDTRIRGTTPWPGAFAFLHRPESTAVRVGLMAGTPVETSVPGTDDAAPGDIPGLVQDERNGQGMLLAVRSADGIFGISVLKPAGKAAMDAASFTNGYLRGDGRARFLPVEQGVL